MDLGDNLATVYINNIDLDGLAQIALVIEIFSKCFLPLPDIGDWLSSKKSILSLISESLQ